jgi:hypothetical protein
MRLPVLIALLAGLWATTAANDVRAETFNTCKGFITSVPATISTQGTWCLSKDISTAIAAGAAIEIATNNVTIDCNGFKIGGLAAGDGSLANGIHALQRLNVTVRNCGVRGFYRGLQLEGDYTSGGHLVEDNRFDNNLQVGIEVHGDGSTVRRNFVYDTGGATGQTFAHGVIVRNDTDVIDNTIANTTALVDPYAMAVVAGYGNVVSGNRIRGLWSVNGYYNRMGIYANNNNQTVIQDNVIVSYGTTTSAVGITCAGTGTGTRLRNNRLLAFGTAHSGCIDDGGN